MEGRGYSDIFIHTQARVIFWGSKFSSSLFWGVFRKINFWGYEDFVDHHKNWTIFCGHFYVFYGLFLRSSYRMRDIIGLLKFQIFLGCLNFLIFLGEM